MEPKTSKSAYSKHQYSGSKKNLKKVRAQLKRYYDGGYSRLDVWRKKSKYTENSENEAIEPSTSRAQVVPEKLKTYARKPRQYLREADYNIQKSQSHIEIPHEEVHEVNVDWPVDPTLGSHELCIETVPRDNLSGLSGNRIVDIQHVLYWAFDLESHRRKCPNSVIEFVSESRSGFNSIFNFKCTMCDRQFRKSNERTQSLNKSFVWGTVTSGSYYSQASHLTNIMDIPTMSPNMFKNIETLLGDVWQEHLTEEIKRNGEQEKKMAIEKGHISRDGVPYITVYVDGGWAKRSYGHDYSSPSGMACIIGKETKKCLYLGIKNKYCFHCHMYEKQNKTVPYHTCFRNYEGPSTGMEAAVLVVGFQKSEEMHGVQYLSFIGDGDSSVYAQLKDNVSYGSQIKKIECKNHVMKNYTSALYKILGNTKLPIYGRKQLRARLSKLTAVARKVIVQNAQDCVALRSDLKNGPLHVFGRHTDCKAYYCKWKTIEETDVDLVDDMKKNAQMVWALVCAANENVIGKSNRLSNETTNVCENLMSLVSKFIGGKRVNLYKSGSYQRRVHIAGLSQISGHKWHEKAWRKCTLQCPGATTIRYIKRLTKKQERQKKYIRKRRFVPCAKPDKQYGPKVQDTVEPINKEDLQKACDAKILDFQKSKTEIKDIETSTIRQHENDLYNFHRSDRLTASHFGVICKRRKKTPCHNHVKSVLYKNDMTTKDMVFGQQNESVARTIFAENYNKLVRPAGLFIDEEHGFLGASPDGVVFNEEAILEIKCFPSLARLGQDLETAAKEKKDFPLLFKDGQFEMNKKHNYYYQVQGQLRIANMQKCYFVCYVCPTQPITVLEIRRDQEFIDEMIPKLAEELNSLLGDAFRMAFASQLRPSAPLWSKEVSGSECGGMGVRAPDSLPGLNNPHCANRSPAKCKLLGMSPLVNSPSASSSEESNSPEEVSCYRRLGDRPPLMRRLARGFSGALLHPSDDDSTPLVADTPTTPTNLPLCLNGGYINEASEAEARTRESNRDHLPVPLPPTPRRNDNMHDVDDFRRCNNMKNSPSVTCSRTESSSSGASSCGGGGAGSGGGSRGSGNNNAPRAEPDLRHAPWFQHGIPREIALEVLSGQPVGAFLVRGSTTQAGCYALSVRVPRDFQPAGIAHYLILRTPKGYKIKGFTKEFRSLSALVTHHSVMPELLPVPLQLPRPAVAQRPRRDLADIDAVAPHAPPTPAHHHTTGFLKQLDV